MKVTENMKKGKAPRKGGENLHDKNGSEYMLRLRPYKACDAETIIRWCKDEVSFRKWTSDRYDSFPITETDMNRKYVDCNGDCSEPDNFYPMTAFDESGIVGHLVMRFIDREKQTLRFGFVIVDDSKRGMGYGREMIRLSLKYAFEILKVKTVTIGVFENNPSAYRCYKAAGFQDDPLEQDECFHILGEDWKCLELKCDAGEACRSDDRWGGGLK